MYVNRINKSLLKLNHVEFKAVPFGNESLASQRLVTTHMKIPRTTEKVYGKP